MHGVENLAAGSTPQPPVNIQLCMVVILEARKDENVVVVIVSSVIVFRRMEQSIVLQTARFAV